MDEHDLQNVGEIRRVDRLAAGENVRQVPKQPWPAQTAATDDHSIATRLAHHSESILSLPDVAVTQNRNPYRLL